MVKRVYLLRICANTLKSAKNITAYNQGSSIRPNWSLKYMSNGKEIRINPITLTFAISRV